MTSRWQLRCSTTLLHCHHDESSAEINSDFVDICTILVLSKINIRCVLCVVVFVIFWSFVMLQRASIWGQSNIRQYWIAVCMWRRCRFQPWSFHCCHRSFTSPRVYVSRYLCNRCSAVPRCCQGIIYTCYFRNNYCRPGSVRLVR